MWRILNVILGLNTSLGRFPELWLMLSTRREKRCWLTRLRACVSELRSAIVDGDVWLSSRVESMRDIRRRHESREHITAQEWMLRRLHALHSFRASAIVALIVFSGLVVTSIGLGLALRRLPGVVEAVGGRVTDYAAVLMTVAEVLGGIAGILFAVIVFGLQFHGERLGEVAFLVRYLRRREGLMPIAGLTLAVVGANACVAIIGKQWLPSAAGFMATFDLIAVPVILGFTLLLLYRMAVSVSEHPFESMLPGLTWEVKQALYEEEAYAGWTAGFQSAVGAAGMSYKPSAGLRAWHSAVVLRCGLAARGRIVDVNLGALSRLGVLLASRCPDLCAELAMAPGDASFKRDKLGAVSDHHAVLLSPRQNEHSCRQMDVTSVDEALRSQIQRSLDAVFRVRPSRESDVPRVLADFQEALEGEAARCSKQQFRRMLRVQEHLLEIHLAYGQTGHSVSFYRDQVPDPIRWQYTRLAETVVETLDHGKVSQFLQFCYAAMGLAIEFCAQDVFARAAETITRVYERATQLDGMADYVGPRLTDFSLGVMDRFAFRLAFIGRFDARLVVGQIPVLLSGLRWALSLFHVAVEANRRDDANALFDCVWRWGRSSRQRYHRRGNENRVAPELREVYDLYMAMTLVLGAWCLWIFRQCKDNKAVAQELFCQCRSMLGCRQEILRVRNTVCGRHDCQHGMAVYFGAGSWTDPVPPRVAGLSFHFGDRDSWCDNGILALLLSRPAEHKTNLTKEHRTALSERAEDPLAVERKCRAILADDDVRKELLGIKDGEADTAVSDVVEMLGGGTGTKG